MKSRITLRIGKILEALTAPAKHRAHRLREGKGLEMEGRGEAGWGGPAHTVQGFTNLALVSRWLSSMRKGRKEGPCSAQSPLRALHDFRTSPEPCQMHRALCHSAFTWSSILPFDPHVFLTWQVSLLGCIISRHT